MICNFVSRNEKIHLCQFLILTLTFIHIAESSTFEESANCGKLLVGLTTRCASVKHSRLEPCCTVLRKWNDAFCWCEANAYDAASNLAMDFFAFQFRAEKCGISLLHHPDIVLPNPGGKVLKSTCPSRVHIKSLESSENCYKKTFVQDLRKRRWQALQVLSGVNIKSSTLEEWSQKLDSVLSPEVFLMSIGLSFSFPRVSVKEYLLYRSNLPTGGKWYSSINEDSVIWRTPRVVSYTSSLSIGPYSFGRIEFVTFDFCSSQIKSIFVQEEQAVRLLKQFVYVEPSDPIFWHMHRSPRRLCRTLKKLCHKYFPYKNNSDCEYRQKEFFARSHITCARGSSDIHPAATHGDTRSCHHMYETLARITPHKYCKAFSTKGIGRCRRRSCGIGEYNNIFTETNPRYSYSLGYTCSSDVCTENWPLGET